MFKVRVEQFGPIKEGCVGLRPLTILIGPNNAGKSYLALLTYVIYQMFGSLSRYVFSPKFRGASDLFLTEETGKWLSGRENQRQEIPFNELPEDLKTYIQKANAKITSEIPGVLTQELKRCFASELTDLVRGRSKNNFHLSLEQTDSLFTLELGLKDGKLVTVTQSFNISEEKFDKRLPFLQAINPLLRGFFLKPSYYFPAARSGILQSHKALASVLISRSPLAGIEPLAIPSLSGVVADFISNLLRLEIDNQRLLERRKRSADIIETATFLESEVCKGKIDLEPTEQSFEYPQVYYEFDSGRIQLHRASSMVSEIAPIALFLKYVINKGDFLVIEEPEAHLHPDNQRILARAIVKLIRAGVQVLITTHSDYFLQQISNFIRLSQASGERLKLGYSENDYLEAEEVGAYLFHFPKKGAGSHVKELKVTSDDGIPEDEFVNIAEAIYDETVRLQKVSVED